MSADTRAVNAEHRAMLRRLEIERLRPVPPRPPNPYASSADTSEAIYRRQVDLVKAAIAHEEQHGDDDDG